jgi:hypothetical protein
MTALLFALLAQPQVEHVLEEKVSEDSEEDDEGAPKEPTAHLHRQAAKLRRGEKCYRDTQQSIAWQDSRKTPSPTTLTPTTLTKIYGGTHEAGNTNQCPFDQT